jgi:hypothetical protein
MSTSTPTRIDLQVELPEHLHDAVQAYLEANPTWSQNRLFTAAVSLFLMQNGVTARDVNRLYLDTVFDYEA